MFVCRAHSIRRYCTSNRNTMALVGYCTYMCEIQAVAVKESCCHDARSRYFNSTLTVVVHFHRDREQGISTPEFEPRKETFVVLGWLRIKRAGDGIRSKGSLSFATICGTVPQLLFAFKVQHVHCTVCKAKYGLRVSLIATGLHCGNPVSSCPILSDDVR